MPRAHRIFLPGHVWHITERCHEQQFLLADVRDRRRWQYWLWESTCRYGLTVLDYNVTSNHVHLLVRDRGCGEIAASMRLIAGRTAQEFNRRQERRGAFWQGRYHATCVDHETYLLRCLTYVDLNMVRAGVVSHPRDWETSGYRELQELSRTRSIIDVDALCELVGVRHPDALREAHYGWVEDALARNLQRCREEHWSNAIAVGGSEFVEAFMRQSGRAATHRRIAGIDGGFVVRNIRGPKTGRRDAELLPGRGGRGSPWGADA